MEAYCMKCKAKREYKGEPSYTEKQTSRGLKAIYRGNCSLCGTVMCKIVKPGQHGLAAEQTQVKSQSFLDKLKNVIDGGDEQ